MFENVWGTIPGGKYLFNTGKEMFKLLLGAGLESMFEAKTAGPKAMVKQLEMNFQEAANALAAEPDPITPLGKTQLSAADVSAAINAFASERAAW